MQSMPKEGVMQSTAKLVVLSQLGRTLASIRGPVSWTSVKKDYQVDEKQLPCLAPFYMRRPGLILTVIIAVLWLLPGFWLPLVLTAILALIFAIGTPSLLGRRFFARIMSDFTPEYNEISHEEKSKHFRTLKGITSADPELRAQGKFRLLEIGCGSGANLKYFPDNCVIVAADNNPSMEAYFRKTLEEMNPTLPLEAFHVTSGGNLKGVADNSIDVVVTTMVLSYISDYDSYFNEILRVLAPGGKYYFWEHVLDPNPRTAQHACQRTLEPYLTPFLGGGQIDKPTWEEFDKRRPLFEDLELQHFTLEPLPHSSIIGKLFIWFIQGTNIRGVVTNKDG